MWRNSSIEASINYTVIPNLFIFGALILILMLMPGWKAPFSIQ